MAKGNLTFKLEGLDAFKNVMKGKGNAVIFNIVKNLNVGAKKIEASAKTSIAPGGKGGKTYRKGTKTEHSASAPGEFPASDQGDLLKMIDVEGATIANPAAQVISRAAHSKPLEYGTRTAAPRPFMQPAFDKNIEEIEANSVKAINKGLKK